MTGEYPPCAPDATKVAFDTILLKIPKTIPPVSL